jgi:hypothetical protein
MTLVMKSHFVLIGLGIILPLISNTTISVASFLQLDIDVVNVADVMPATEVLPSLPLLWQDVEGSLGPFISPVRAGNVAEFATVGKFAPISHPVSSVSGNLSRGSLSAARTSQFFNG